MRHPNYRLYFFGQVVSQSGTWLQRIAQSWLVLDLANSPAALGVLTVFQFLPAMLLSLVAGVVADRVGKQRLIMITSTARSSAGAELAAVTLGGHAQLWEVYVLALLLGPFTTFETPARQAFVSELVPREDVQSAVALNSSVFNAARIVGPGIGGLMIATWGAGWAFALNGLSYVAVLITLAMLDTSKLFAGRGAARGALWSQMWDGLRHAVKTPRLAFPLALLAVIGLLGYNFGVVLPLLARYSGLVRCCSGRRTTTCTTPARTWRSARCWGIRTCRSSWAISTTRRPIGPRRIGRSRPRAEDARCEVTG